MNPKTAATKRAVAISPSSQRKGANVVNACKARDAGMAQALDHADAVDPSWSMEAAKLLQRFIRRSGVDFFTTEQARSWAYDRGLMPPPDDRAWGALLRSAANLGMIRKRGYTQSEQTQAHMRPVTRWQVVP